MTSPAPNPGTLYVVATPIGNLGDMVPRAVETLQTVDLIACEDTRHSAHLLQHFGIKTPCVAYHDHSDQQRVQQLLDRLGAGQSIALISDAGTPLISDPGYSLVRLCRDAGVKIVPIPGPCALIAALCCAGLPTDKFHFIGFLPAKSGQRQQVLSDIPANVGTLITYEAARRVKDTLADVAMKYWKNDLRSDLANTVPSSEDGNPAFWQHMVTFGVGLGVEGTISSTTAFNAIGASSAISWPNPLDTQPAKIDDLLHFSCDHHILIFYTSCHA